MSRYKSKYYSLLEQFALETKWKAGHYNSILAELAEKTHRLTIGSAINQVIHDAFKPEKGPKELAKLIILPTRIIASSLDFYMEQNTDPTSTNRLLGEYGLLMSSTLALYVLWESNDAGMYLEQYKVNKQNEGLLNRPLKPVPAAQTVGIHPTYTKRVAKTLIEQGDRGLQLLPLANGGLPCAVDAYIRFLHAYPSDSPALTRSKIVPIVAQSSDNTHVTENQDSIKRIKERMITVPTVIMDSSVQNMSQLGITAKMWYDVWRQTDSEMSFITGVGSYARGEKGCFVDISTIPSDQVEKVYSSLHTYKNNTESLLVNPSELDITP